MTKNKKVILIAEDSRTQAMKLRFLLEDSHYKVVHGIDGKEASEILKQTIPDLIISDVMMPNMDGFEFSKYVKTNEKYKHIPLVLLTSLSDYNDVIMGLACGANTFLTKPIDNAHLLKTIDKILNGNVFEPQIKAIFDEHQITDIDERAVQFLISAYQTAISQNKALEESKDELKKVNLNLEKKVIERTEELNKAKKRAEKSDMLKSIFLSNVSHDLRTPMNAIIGFSDLLRDDDITKENKDEFIDVITKNGENLLSLINDIIDISKIEAGIIKCNTENAYPLNELLNDLEMTFQQYKSLKDSEDVELFFNKGNSIEDLFVYTDAYRLRQIFSNLLSNAVKFTKKGFIEFGYDLISEDTLQFYVKDTGIGIPDEKIKNLFDRYEQVKTSNSPDVGTGLGLAIAKNLSKILGGKMWLESSLGKGSIFYFTMPYLPAEDPLMDYFPKAPKKTHDYDFTGKMFMIVEDDLSNFRFLKVLLEKVNAKVIWAKDGEQAVQLFKQNPDIALILMDIHLPKLNGFEATKKILSINSEIPIIAQTAFAMSGDEQDCLEAGCTDYIPKPIKKPILLSKIHKLLQTT